MRNNKEQLTKEFVEQFISYNPSTGDFTRVKTVAHNAVAGSLAGYIDSDGYRKVGIDSAYYRGHRLAWLLYYGVWPKEDVDHINHVKSDNRICNLQESDRAGQQYNRPARADNKSGVCGVFWHKRDLIWEVNIRVNKKCIYLGRFVDFEKAVEVRKAAEKKYGFHENHGK